MLPLVSIIKRFHNSKHAEELLYSTMYCTVLYIDYFGGQVPITLAFIFVQNYVFTPFLVSMCDSDNFLAWFTMKSIKLFL